jgi:cytochrome b561
MPAQTITRFSAFAQVLHWLTAILVLVAFIYGPGGSEAHVYASARDFDRHLHESLGISVLALTALRLLWRAFDKRPDPTHGARWMMVTASVVQAALYVLLFAVPFTAITGAWLEGHALTFLWGMQIPPPISEHHAVGTTIAEIHTWLGDTILWVAGLHAVAGLYHHFVLKDGVLTSMLPLRRTGDPT